MWKLITTEKKYVLQLGQKIICVFPVTYKHKTYPNFLPDPKTFIAFLRKKYSDRLSYPNWIAQP